ncbi:MAG: LmbE family protein, partial [bacterium]
PNGLRDSLGQLVEPGAFVNTSAVLARKSAMLACHASQKEWLDVSQGMDAYLEEMARMSAEVGRMSGRFRHAEGWLIHSTLGFGSVGFNPLMTMLKGDYYGKTAE